MPPSAELIEAQQTAPQAAPQTAIDSVAEEARRGLCSMPKALAPWLFYDEAGSRLFEQITALPEYYLTRTERDIFIAHAAEMFNHVAGFKRSEAAARGHEQAAGASNGAQSKQPGWSSDADSDVELKLDFDSERPPLTVLELGAGTAAKTGILLRALTQVQPQVTYQPIDISPTALDHARTQLEAAVPCLSVRPLVANYVTQSYQIERDPGSRVLALYIGSSIGNFSPAEGRHILSTLRAQLEPGDALLLGTDLAPCSPEASRPTKAVSTLLAAYNDKQGITAAFNRNILGRLNRELGADFNPDLFAHRALWNPAHSRIEIYLTSLLAQQATVPANSAGPALHLNFFRGESIHTENSYKFTPAAITALLTDSGFTPTRSFTDPQRLFAVTLAAAI